MSLSYSSQYAHAAALHDSLKLLATMESTVMREFIGGQIAALIDDLGGLASAW